MMFSDNTPSMAYFADASWGSWGEKTYDTGKRQIHYQANFAAGYAAFNFYANTAPKNVIGISVAQEQPPQWRKFCDGGGYTPEGCAFYCCGDWDYSNCNGWDSCLYYHEGWYYPPPYTYSNSLTISDNARVAHYTVVSYARPTIFVYSTNSSCGANVVKITDSGTTGAGGYAVWNIDVLLTYAAGATDATAQSSVRLLAFGKVDPSYNNEGHGMFIRNDSSQTMFHSDFEPCKVKDIMTISFATGGVTNPTQSYQSGSSTTVAGLSKPAYQAVELGRRRQEFGFSIAIGWTIYIRAIEMIAGLRWTGTKWQANWVSIDLSSHHGTSSAGNVFYEPGAINIPIIDANDY